MPAADAVVLMQEILDSTGAPMFDASTFLDEDQIKSMFGTISHSRKRSLVLSPHGQVIGHAQGR